MRHGEDEDDRPDEEDTPDEEVSSHDEDDGGEEQAIDDRVAGAFDALNAAIARNNEVEAAHAEAALKLQLERKEGEVSLAILENKHAAAIRKLRRFRTEQAKALAAAQSLRDCESDLVQAKSLLECASEALDLLHERVCSGDDSMQWDDHSGWRESAVALEERKAAATQSVRQLEEARRRCAAEAARHTRRLLACSAQVGEQASAALPYLARQASMEHAEAVLGRELSERSQETAKAKASVRAAMGELERISLDIMQSQQQRVPAPPSTADSVLAAAAASPRSELNSRSSQWEPYSVAARTMPAHAQPKVEDNELSSSRKLTRRAKAFPRRRRATKLLSHTPCSETRSESDHA